MPSKLEITPRIGANSFLPHQEELQQLGELCGVQMSPQVFRILVEFLNLGVDPETIYTVLKSIRRSITRPKPTTSSGSSVKGTN